MARVITLVLCVAIGLVFLSRSCTWSRPGDLIVLTNGRIVSGNGSDQATRFVAIAGGKITAIGRVGEKTEAPAGGRTLDVNGLFIAATTFDRKAETLIDGIRHVWVGHVNVGDPGDVVVMRNNPGRVRPGYIPETDAIVAAVVDGVYYTARELNTRR
jgi:hypothetical protein